MKYYAGVGTYQETLGELYRRFVPETGWSGTRVGELVRAASALYRAEYDEDMQLDPDQANYFRYLLMDHFLGRSILYRIRITLFYTRAKDEDWDWLMDLVVKEASRLANVPLVEEDPAYAAHR